MAAKKVQSIKLTEEELSQIKNLEQRNSALNNEIARVGLVKLSLKQSQDTIEAYYKENVQIEKQIAKTLEDKYGPGRVDTATGEFIPG